MTGLLSGSRRGWAGDRGLRLLGIVAIGIAGILLSTAVPVPPWGEPLPPTLPPVPRDLPWVFPPSPPPTPREDPPEDPTDDPPIPPAPSWDPPPETEWNGSTDWEEFVRGPTYLENLSTPFETAHYWSNVSKAFPWTDDALRRLRQNGFVVLPNPSKADIELMYRHYWVSDLPVFVTTDTILHAHHLLFDQMLQDLENASLRPMLENMSAALLDRAVTLRATLPQELGAAGRDAVVFFAVPNVLLATGKAIPADVQEEVAGIVAKILAAKGAEFTAFWDGIAEFTDWTQYKPRGHYDRSEFLKRFFRAMMWYGRASFTITDTLQVVPGSVVAAVVGTSPLGEALWTRIYNSTARLIGESDSLNHFDVRRAFLASLGRFDPGLLADEANVDRLVEEFESDEYYRQKILSTILLVDPVRAEEGRQVKFPKIFQLMGQRYVLDSEVMQNLIFDRVPLYEGRRRGLPSGLDIATVSGSSRAVGLLENELSSYDYEAYLASQWSAVQNKSEGFWGRTSYSRHLRAFQEVLREPADGAPDFMRTRAWATEKVNTALGSWAELRHDTILYAKQPYSIGITCSTPEGWVEPYPDFFRWMALLADDIVVIIEDHFDASVDPAKRFVGVFRDFATINRRLAEIADRELEGRDLPPEDVRFIRDIFVKSVTDSYGFIVANYGWLPDLLAKAKVTDKTRDSRIIADVATDPDPAGPQVLHVGLGTFLHLVVAYQTADGDWHVAAGPVYGYYEFALAGLTRLSDEEWKTRLGGTPRPARPFWTSDFLSQ